MAAWPRRNAASAARGVARGLAGIAGLALRAAARPVRQERRAGPLAAQRRQGRTLFAADDRRHRGRRLGAADRRDDGVPGGGGAGRTRCARARSFTRRAAAAYPGGLRRRRRDVCAGSRARPGRLVDRGRPAGRRAPGERNRAAGGQPLCRSHRRQLGAGRCAAASWRSPARILRDVRQRHRPGHRPLRQLPLARGNPCRHGAPAQRGRLCQPARSRPVGGGRRRRRSRVRRGRLGRGREPAADHRRRPLRRRDAGRGAIAPRGGACAPARRGLRGRAPA